MPKSVAAAAVKNPRRIAQSAFMRAPFMRIPPFLALKAMLEHRGVFVV